jgi:hypothetical protein
LELQSAANRGRAAPWRPIPTARRYAAEVARPRQPPSPAFAEVRRELQQPWTITAGDADMMAERLHETAQLFDPFARKSGLILAGKNGYLVIPRPDVGCGVSGLVLDVLLVRPSNDDARWNLRVLHELAHARLDAAGPHHTHADVWALTLALAIPRHAYRRHHEARHVPRWVVTLRRQVAQVVARAA